MTRVSLSTTSARSVILHRYPEGAVQASDFAVAERPLPVPGDGEFLVGIDYVSVDPMLRLFIDPKPFGGGMPAMPLGSPIPGAAVGRIIESRHPGFKAGEVVEGRFGWNTLAVSNGVGVQRVSPALGPIENALGIGGLPGFTAYVGLRVAGELKADQTVLVSGAAGAVGSVVGALLKARGIRVVGIAGGEEKRRYLMETVGYDAVADRLAPDFEAQLAQALPRGADLYFDNVGGPLVTTVAKMMARGGLILICGLMSQYQHDKEADGIDRLPELLSAVMFRGLRLQAFTQAGQDALRPAFEQEIGRLLQEGRIKPELHIEQGLEQLPAALAGLFQKGRSGKVVVRVGND